MNSFEPNITPRDIEIKIGVNTNFYIKLNDKEHIDYVNSDFCNLTGYEDFELIDENLLSIWHPDMPLVIHDVTMESVKKGEKVELIIKLLIKDGRYCWTHTIIDAKINDYGEVIGFYIHCKAVSEQAAKEIASLIYVLKKIEEKSHNTKVSRRYLIGFLEDRKTSLTNFIINLTKTYPVGENTPKFINDTGYQPYRSSQNTGTTFGNYGAQQSTIQEQKKEVKKSLFQRIFGSKQ